MQISEFRDLLANDGFAATFQTMGQYRTELLRALDGLRAQADARPVAWRVTGHWKDGAQANPFFYTDEALADMHAEHLASAVIAPLYTHPEASAPGLSDEEIFELWCSIPTLGGIDDDIVPFARALLTRASAATVANTCEEPCGDMKCAVQCKKGATVAEPSDQPKWRCFHCDETFNDAESAALHFGKSAMQSPACLIDIAEYRSMEQRMHRYNEEDTDLHREIHGLRAKHQVDLMREEEKGYARGLADGMNEAAQQQTNQGASHEWDATGERCLKCGDKDWFAGSACSGKAAQQQAEPGADERAASEAYDKVDRFLRNNLDDVDYAEYSEALECVRVAQSGQRAGVAAQQEAGLVDALMAACKTLPAGYNIHLDAENGWAGVELVDPNGNSVDYSDGESSLTEQVIAATKKAIAAAPTQQQEGV